MIIEKYYYKFTLGNVIIKIKIQGVTILNNTSHLAFLYFIIVQLSERWKTLSYKGEFVQASCSKQFDYRI